MKKATLPLYTLLVAGWLACLQLNDSFLYVLSPSYSGSSVVSITSRVVKNNAVLLMPQAFSKQRNCSSVNASRVVIANHSIPGNINEAIQINQVTNTTVRVNW